MKKASQIVLLIAGILAIVGAVMWLLAGISFVAMGGIVIAIDNGTIAQSDLPESVTQLINQIQTQYPNLKTLALVASWLITVGVIYLIIFIFSIPAAILSFLARNKDNKILYILCIVFGVLSSTFVASVGGILGLIHQAVDKPSEEQA